MTRAARKTSTREAILRSAAELLKRNGLGGTSVERVMKGAGLTVGGFYAHFACKSELAAAALRRAFAQNMGALFEGQENASPAEQYARAVRRYLSRQHRDMAREVCPVPACLSEIEPTDEPVRDALVEGVDGLANRLAALVEDEPGLSARERALGSAATFIGAMALARAARGTAWSDEVLLSARKLLLKVEGGR